MRRTARLARLPSPSSSSNPPCTPPPSPQPIPHHPLIPGVGDKWLTQRHAPSMAADLSTFLYSPPPLLPS
ncbi:hypothetical protein PCANC_25140 [Puccinia coronata f. sp. avenae]|uniref:Uncharacterized protein n=1 Tax=Puccinia coronata f. sp. avenae TaxID=200324 RepID=A0A2N5U0N3_9BASI|nr:hypothetical protein PCANC_25140 [Puccinia coronata f. sp. avenae]